MTVAAVSSVKTEPFRKVGLGYVWDHPEHAIRISAEGIRDRSDELSAEIVIEDTRRAQPIHMVLHRMNLMSRQTRSSLAKELDAQCSDDDDYARIDWKQVIEQFSVGVIHRFREGEPTMHVAELQAKPRRPDLIEKVLHAGKPTLWYGPQGAGKGWLCCEAAVCVACGIPFAGLRVSQPVPVLYLDWEDNEDTFSTRVECVIAGLGREVPDIPVFYRKMHGQLPRQVPRVLRDIEKHGIGLVIVDSVGLAMGAKSDGNGGYEDQAISFFESIRYLEPAAVLLVDHVTGEYASNGKLAHKAFGSVYKMAEARGAWEIRKEQDADSDEQIIGMHHEKHNHTRKYGAIGLRLEFTNEDDDLVAVRLIRHDLGDTVELRKQLPQKDQILQLLKRGASTQDEVADQCCKGQSDVARAQLNQLKRAGKVIKLDDNRWAVPAFRPVIVPGMVDEDD